MHRAALVGAALLAFTLCAVEATATWEDAEIQASLDDEVRSMSMLDAGISDTDVPTPTPTDTPTEHPTSAPTKEGAVVLDCMAQGLGSHTVAASHWGLQNPHLTTHALAAEGCAMACKATDKASGANHCKVSVYHSATDKCYLYRSGATSVSQQPGNGLTCFFKSNACMYSSCTETKATQGTSQLKSNQPATITQNPKRVCWKKLCTSCDYSGQSETKHSTDGTLAACQESCAADSQCKGIDFGKGERAKECYHNFGGDSVSLVHHGSFDAYTPALCDKKLRHRKRHHNHRPHRHWWGRRRLLEEEKE